jgi:hypothetical protein
VRVTDMLPVLRRTVLKKANPDLSDAARPSPRAAPVPLLHDTFGFDRLPGGRSRPHLGGSAPTVAGPPSSGRPRSWTKRTEAPPRSKPLTIMSASRVSLRRGKYASLALFRSRGG